MTLLFYVNNQLPNRTIKIDTLTIEIIIRKKKFLLREYKPNLSEIDFSTSLESIISRLSNKYEKLIFMGDFNMTPSNPTQCHFLGIFVFSPLYIDLVLGI